MKKPILIYSFLLFFIVTHSVAQCDEQKNLSEILSGIDDGQYIRDFTARFDQSTPDSTGIVRYAVILNGRCQYKFRLLYSSFSPGDVTMELYDGEKLVGSNVGGGKVYDAFGFICKTTRMYTLVLNNKSGADGCVRTILSLQKQFTDEDSGFQ